MPYRKVSLWIVTGISTVIALFCLYVVVVNVRVGDMRVVWIFTAFGALFSIPLIYALFHFIADKNPAFKKKLEARRASGHKHKTAFVPHWFVMSGILLIGLVMLYAVIKWLFTYFAR